MMLMVPHVLNMVAPSLQPSLQLESPSLWPHFEHVQPFQVKYCHQRKWYTESVPG